MGSTYTTVKPVQRTYPLLQHLAANIREVWFKVYTLVLSLSWSVPVAFTRTIL